MGKTWKVEKYIMTFQGYILMPNTHLKFLQPAIQTETGFSVRGLEIQIFFHWSDPSLKFRTLLFKLATFQQHILQLILSLTRPAIGIFPVLPQTIH